MGLRLRRMRLGPCKGLIDRTRGRTQTLKNNTEYLQTKFKIITKVKPNLIAMKIVSFFIPKGKEIWNENSNSNNAPSQAGGPAHRWVSLRVPSLSHCSTGKPLRGCWTWFGHSRPCPGTATSSSPLAGQLSPRSWTAHLRSPPASPLQNTSM